jgi:hypothetical protein
MRTYDITITGKMPLIMHADNIEWADEMERWKNDPTSKKKSKAGDDRSPAFRWLGALYHDDKEIAIPSDNLMRCFMEGGAMVPVPGGKSGKTFKSQTQSGMLVEGTHWPLLVSGKPIPVAKVLALKTESDFGVHRETVEQLGFSLFLKRAKIGQNKHVRVRPRFEEWSGRGRLLVWDDQITTDALSQIMEQAGLYKGIGDWRPGGKTPGPFGTFTAKVQAA